ncbi:hypothetical protein Droror1_Dr00008969 [Drosera rotundifolia]
MLRPFLCSANLPELGKPRLLGVLLARGSSARGKELGGATRVLVDEGGCLVAGQGEKRRWPEMEKEENAERSKEADEQCSVNKVVEKSTHEQCRRKVNSFL